MFGLGAAELIIIVAILVLIFGPTKIPELARAIGEAIREMRGVASVAGSKEKEGAGEKKDTGE